MLNSVVKLSTMSVPSISNTTPLYLGGPFFRGLHIGSFTTRH